MIGLAGTGDETETDLPPFASVSADSDRTLDITGEIDFDRLDPRRDDPKSGEIILFIVSEKSRVGCSTIWRVNYRRIRDAILEDMPSGIDGPFLPIISDDCPGAAIRHVVALWRTITISAHNPDDRHYTPWIL